MAQPEWWEETYADHANTSEDVDREPDPEAVADFEAFMLGTEAPQTEIVPAPTLALDRRKEGAERIESLTDEVLTEAMSGIRAAQRWHEIDPADEGPPEVWIRELGEKEALRQWRIASAATMPTKHVPYGLKMSVDVAAGIMKARGKDEPAKQLNVQFIQIQQPVFNYPSKRVEK